MNAPRTWPNSCDAAIAGGTAARLTATNGPAGAARRVVEGARDQLLAGAGLAAEQHRRVEVGHAQDLGADAPNGLAVADQAEVRNRRARSRRRRWRSSATRSPSAMTAPRSTSAAVSARGAVSASPSTAASPPSSAGTTVTPPAASAFRDSGRRLTWRSPIGWRSAGVPRGGASSGSSRLSRARASMNATSPMRDVSGCRSRLSARSRSSDRAPPPSGGCLTVVPSTGCFRPTAGPSYRNAGRVIARPRRAGMRAKRVVASPSVTIPTEARPAGPGAAVRARPLVTANQVTVARLIPMPLIAWLIYQGETGWWIAICIALVVGSTDYLDGHLARKHGPTVLGALLDPLADKVFLAFMYVPLADLGLLPALADRADVRARVPGHRDAQRLRPARHPLQDQLPGQGQDLGPDAGGRHPDAVRACSAAPAALRAPDRRPWRCRSCCSSSCSPSRGRLLPESVGGHRLHGACRSRSTLFAEPRGDITIFFAGCAWILTALTWVSGLDYLVGGLPRLRAAGGFGRADAVRVLAAGALPVLLAAAWSSGHAPPWAVLALFATELARRRARQSAVAARPRRARPALGRAHPRRVALLVALALAFAGAAAPLTIAALAVSAAGVAVEFWRARDLYL